MKQFPLDSQLDLGTVDIIQSEPQYKRKNSLMYQGILSNMTMKNGRGILSTTGRELQTYSNEVYAGGYKLIEYDDSSYLAGNYESGDKPHLIAYRKIFRDEDHGGGEDGSFSEVFVTFSGGEYRVICEDMDLDWDFEPDDEPECKKAVIFPNGLVMFTSHSSQIVFFNIYSEEYYSIQVLNHLGAQVIDSETKLYGSQAHDIIIGIDNKDIRKRMTLIYREDDDGLPWTKLRTIYGFGCVHEETGVITGEPVPIETVETINSGTTQHIRWQITSDFNYTRRLSSTNGNSNITIADNGVYSISPVDPSRTSFRRRHWNDSSYLYGTHTDMDIKNETVSYATSVAKVGPQNEEGTQGSDNRPDWYRSSPTFDMQNDESWFNSNSGNDLVIIYVYGFDWSSGGLLFGCAERATKRWKGQAVTGRSFGGSSVSFIDFDRPVGKVGWNQNATQESISTLDQIYPHLRHFYNDTTRKGKYWDYGPGWVRFFWDTIYTREYDNPGFVIFEAPLRLYNIRLESGSGQFSHRSTQIDFNTQNQDCLYTKNDHTDWPYFAASYQGTNENVRQVGPQDVIYFDGQDAYGMPYNKVRMHPRLEQYQTQDWVWSHSLTGTDISSSLNACPTRHRIKEDLDLIYYNGIPIAIAKGDTLINTPHDLGDNWTITYGGRRFSITFWTDDTYESVELCTFNSDARSFDLEIRKVEDYVFVTNVIGEKNVIVESRKGGFTAYQGFLSYAMDCYLDAEAVGFTLKLPPDSSSYLSNDVLYYGSGINSLIKETYPTTSFLLPAITINAYIDTADSAKFTSQAVMSRKIPIVSRAFDWCSNRIIPTATNVQEYYTHSQLTTDVSYKDSFFLVQGASEKSVTYEEDYADTTWIPGLELVLYPIGIMSKTYGENYITATVDAGDGYVARFYNKDNKTFLIFNQSDLVYYGSEIFTIMSGNYYFDGQGIYYLGSQSDYSQNVFTAYALGMRFLANSSSEAYFYSEWDKCIYLYTASNTLQKSFSLADRPDIVDAVYSTNEQCLYILFTDGSLYIKSQADDCLIEYTGGEKLQTTEQGAFVITGDGYYNIYNPQLYDKKEKLILETEWLGDSIAVQKTSYVDVVLYSDVKKEVEFELDVQMIQNGVITSDKKTLKVSKSDWKNQLARIRFVPTKENLQGNAVKIVLTSDDISIFALNVEMNPVSTMTATRLR